MNINMTVCCDTCGEFTNCRIGMSNRNEQPLRFNCQDCGSPIDITIGGNAPGLVGATQVQNTQPFDTDINFVDLHLDFPVTFEPYEIGMTPFIRASERLGVAAIALHQQRLDHLNTEMEKSLAFKNLLKLYANGKTDPFKANCKKIFDIVVASDLQEDINAALYNLLAKMMFPFALPKQNADSVQLFLRILSQLERTRKAGLDRFVGEMLASSFLKNLQLDALEIYPAILAAELPLRPALFLDFDLGYAANPVAMRVSTADFESYRDLFKDISEVISRQLTLVAGINNLLKRRDHDAFAPQIIKQGKNVAPRTLHGFADCDFGRKWGAIDNSWYQPLDGAFNNKLRNAIAHFKAEYDHVKQVVTYYPRKEGIKQEHAEQMTFLEFMRWLLVSYREMHRLHHLIKALFYYSYLILNKDKAASV